MRLLIDWLIAWPERVARHLMWLAPLFARITVGWVFLLSGWGKLNNLPQVTENFIGWGIPFPALLHAVDVRHRIFWRTVPTARIVDAHISRSAGRDHDRGDQIGQVGRRRFSRNLARI